MMHYYSFNIADYKKDTAHLKPMEHYIYRSLIDLYYLDETPIPLKTHSVMRRLSLETHDHEKMLLDVLNDFFDEQDDGFYHKRIDAEIEKYQANAEKNRENGKKGGRPPKKGKGKTQSDTSGNQLESELNPNQEPLTNNQEPLTNINIPFDDFWDAYDYKVGKKSKVESKWDSLTDAERELIMINVPLYKESKPDKQFRLHPMTYLNNEGWTHEIVTKQGNNNGSHQSANNRPQRETQAEWEERTQREFNQEFGMEVQAGSSTDSYS